jgi:hypothetical protein
VFGELEVILCHDPVPGQSFGAGQGQIAFIVSLKVLRIPRLEAGEPGRLISLGGSGSSRHWQQFQLLFALYSPARRLIKDARINLAISDEAIAFGYPRERVF